MRTHEHGPTPPVPQPGLAEPNYQNIIQLAHWSNNTPTPGLTHELDGDGFVDLVPGGITWFECDPASLDVYVPSVLCMIGMGMGNSSLTFASCFRDKNTFAFSPRVMFTYAKGSKQWNIYRQLDPKFDEKSYFLGMIGSGRVKVWAQIV